MTISACHHHSESFAIVDKDEVPQENGHVDETKRHIEPCQTNPVSPRLKNEDKNRRDEIADKGHTNNRIGNNLFHTVRDKCVQIIVIRRLTSVYASVK